MYSVIKVNDRIFVKQNLSTQFRVTASLVPCRLVMSEMEEIIVEEDYLHNGTFQCPGRCAGSVNAIRF